MKADVIKLLSPKSAACGINHIYISAYPESFPVLDKGDEGDGQEDE